MVRHILRSEDMDLHLGSGRVEYNAGKAQCCPPSFLDEMTTDCPDRPLALYFGEHVCVGAAWRQRAVGGQAQVRIVTVHQLPFQAQTQVRNKVLVFGARSMRRFWTSILGPTSRPSDNVINGRVARELPVASALLIRQELAQKLPFNVLVHAR